MTIRYLDYTIVQMFILLHLQLCTKPRLSYMYGLRDFCGVLRGVEVQKYQEVSLSR